MLSNVSDTPGVSEFGVNFSDTGRILYLAPSYGQGYYDIFSRDGQGGNPRRLTRGEMAYNGPLWQYGPWIVFQSGNDLWYHDLRSGANRNLTDGVGINYGHSLYIAP